jgi:hypothetical protein
MATKKTTKAAIPNTVADNSETLQKVLESVEKLSERLDRLEQSKLVTESVAPPPIETTSVEVPQVHVSAVNVPLLTTPVEVPATNPKRNIDIRFWVCVVIIVVLILTNFFRFAPITGQSELTSWTKQQCQSLPKEYRSEIKAIFRAAYQETASAIQSNDIVTTADARLRISQLIQAKILSLNRLSKNPQELETILQAMQPLSNAIGEHLSSDVNSGKMNDNLESVQKAFSEIAAGFK